MRTTTSKRWNSYQTKVEQPLTEGARVKISKRIRMRSKILSDSPRRQAFSRVLVRLQLIHQAIERHHLIEKRRMPSRYSVFIAEYDNIAQWIQRGGKCTSRCMSHNLPNGPREVVVLSREPKKRSVLRIDVIPQSSEHAIDCIACLLNQKK